MDEAKQQAIYFSSGVVFLDRALAIWTRNPRTATKELISVTLEDIDVPVWTEAEITKLDEGIEEHQDDLEEIADSLPKKRLKDVVNYIYIAKPHT